MHDSCSKVYIGVDTWIYLWVKNLKIADGYRWACMAGALTTVSLQTVARGTLAPLPLEELQQLAAVFGMVKSNYVEPVDDKKLITDAIAGMVSSLDPHSAVLRQKDRSRSSTKAPPANLSGSASRSPRKTAWSRWSPRLKAHPPFAPASKPNDLITRIDDTAVKGLTLNEGVKRMRGEPNTKVVLTIFRKDENRTFPVTIIREEIRTQSVRGKVIEPGYAWIRLSQFQERTVEDFARKIDEIYKQEPATQGLGAGPAQ